VAHAIDLHEFHFRMWRPTVECIHKSSLLAHINASFQQNTAHSALPSRRPTVRMAALAVDNARKQQSLMRNYPPLIRADSHGSRSGRAMQRTHSSPCQRLD